MKKWGAFLLSLFALCTVSSSAQQSASSRKAPEDACVIIKTATSVGSGFIADMDGKKYLITNDHVMRGGPPMTAQLLDGTKVTSTNIEVSATRDLVRLPLDASNSLPALPLAVTSRLGQPIFVYGNSDGASVVTSVSGSIVGLGTDEVETDAEFVRGNSGSPMVLRDGSVLAVATYATRNPEPSDWIKQGTRFADIRRFGFRLAGTQWVRMSLKEYYLRADCLTDMQTLCKDLCILLSSHTLASNAGHGCFRQRNDFAAFLKTFAEGYSRTIVRASIRSSQSGMKQSDIVLGLRDPAGFAAARKQARTNEYYRWPSDRRLKMRVEDFVNSCEARDNSAFDAALQELRKYSVGAKAPFLQQLRQFVNQSDWKVRTMNDEALFWLRVFELAEPFSPRSDK